ncbi:glycosyltransferase, partial [Candidatus Pacearchaeota archaeon]|nr:glycosyltransferase [Candidatus Pacearchaeota archaeon]
MKKRKTKIRVLQLIAAPEMGGIENQLLAFLQRYDREKFVVEVLCGTSTDGQLREKYLETETKLALCQWSRYVIPYIWRLLKALSRGNYDVVHARSAEVSGASILAAWLMRVPNRVASYHHTETAWSRPGIANKLAIKTLQWITRRCATKIYGISEVALDAYFSDWRHFPHKFLV